MKILDFHVRELLPHKPSFGSPSANKGCRIVADLVDRTDREIQDTWLPWRASCALLYAASLVPVGKDESLLDLIASDRAIYSKIKSHIPNWLGFARSITEEVLGNMKFELEADGNIPKFRRVPVVQHPLSPLTPKEEEATRKEFQRKNGVAAKPLKTSPAL
jgi:hypothetical protein